MHTDRDRERDPVCIEPICGRSLLLLWWQPVPLLISLPTFPHLQVLVQSKGQLGFRRNIQILAAS